MLSTPVLGPLAKAAINTISPDTSPQEAALPIARLPFLGLPFPIPIPNLERLYIRCASHCLTPGQHLLYMSLLHCAAPECIWASTC